VLLVAVEGLLCWLASYLKSSVFFEQAEIQENAIRKLRAITERAFQEAFQQWKKRWERLEGTTLKRTVLKML
jgi:energy-converting hydrogenase A subunit M